MTGTAVTDADRELADREPAAREPIDREPMTVNRSNVS
ncbi:hypothetical protein QFZ67_002892 [Streptomyces sp. V1I1]|nr:hypothetical protein [Streptomyces sp. V1I1]